MGRMNDRWVHACKGHLDTDAQLKAFSSPEDATDWFAKRVDGTCKSVLDVCSIGIKYWLGEDYSRLR